MKKIIFIILVFCAGSLPGQQSPPLRLTRERTFDVVHYKLVLAVDVKKKICGGDAFITLVPLRPSFDTVRLDAAEMEIARVTLHDRPLKSSLSGDTLSIVLDKPYGLSDTLVLDIKYAVHAPKKGLYFITPDSGYADQQWQAWTQGEAEDNHYWFPCYDYPNDVSSSELMVTVDNNFTVVSNGVLLRKTEDARNHKVTFHWSEPKPHVSYLISLAIGTYLMVPDTAGSLPLEHYVYPLHANDALRSFGHTPAMIDLFEKKTGYPFPWEKYGHALVAEFMFSGEENVSVATITDRTMHDARADLDYSSEPLVAHELAHQWWGDLVAFRDWSHAWLSEGFATFFEMVYEEQAHGHEYAGKVLYDAQQVVLNSDKFDNRRPTVCQRYNHPMELFDNRIYQKGACVLHMLRFVLGEELFWKSINHYIHKFAFQNVETNDFKIAIEEATGYNLQWFFDEWLYHAGYPEFNIQTVWDKTTQSVNVIVQQRQRVDSLTPVFRMPVDIEVWVHDAPEVYRVEINEREEKFSFPAYQKPQLVIFDKGGQLLKRETFQKSHEEWLYQFQYAKDGIDRLVALEELQWIVDSPSVRTAFQKAMLDDNFPPVRCSATWALGDARTMREPDDMIKAYGDRESSVRLAGVTGLGRLRGEKVVNLLRHAFARDSSYTVAAAALRSLTMADSLHRREYLKEGLRRDSYNESIRSTALQCYSELGDDDARDTIIAYTRYGIDRRIRLQAIRSLGAVWGNREDVVQYLFRFLTDPGYHVRRVTVEVLEKIGTKAVMDRLKDYLSNETDPRLREAAKDAVENIEKTLQKNNAD